jgi:hypothetical protein
MTVHSLLSHPHSLSNSKAERKESKVFYGVTLFMHEKVKDCEQGYYSLLFLSSPFQFGIVREGKESLDGETVFLFLTPSQP